jgi:hypothetical protein
MMAEIHATFPDPSGAREAEMKLLALRAIQVHGGNDGGSLTATVDEDVVDRALHLIRQTGGTPE